MTIPEDKVCVSVILEKEVVEFLDNVAQDCGMSRSKLIVACIEAGIDDLKMFEMIGFPLRRLAKIRKKYEKVLSTFFGGSDAEGPDGVSQKV